jgi:protein SERAC1
MKLSELHCIISFANEYSYPSLQSWEDSEEYLSQDKQLDMVIGLSRGLVEPVVSTEPDPTFQFIHESVRDFFLKGSGFQLLDPAFSGSVRGQGHSAIARTCVNYLKTSEVKDAAENARLGKAHAYRIRRRRSCVSSCHSH